MSALGEVQRQHVEWAARHARLVRGPAPPPKPQRPRPVSPFVLEARERRRAQREAFERQIRNAAAGIDIGSAVDTNYGWPAYHPVAPYDECAALPGRAPLTMRQIIRQVAEKHGIMATDIVSARRNRTLVLARHEAMWRCKAETTFSLPQIGRAFGNRDHTTVIHGIKMHEKRMGSAVDG